MELEDLISVQPGKVDQQRQHLRQRLLHGDEHEGGDGLQEQARKDYGIEVVDIRLRRSNHPVAVREAIFERIRSERNKKAADYRSEGDQKAKDIKTDAERKVRALLADARAAEQRIKGEADVEADRIRNEAHGRDVQFYTFLKKLEEYQRILGDNKTMLLLSTHRDLFDLLLQPPRPEGPAASKSASEDKMPRGGGK